MPTEVEEGYKQKLSIDVIYSFPVLLVGMWRYDDVDDGRERSIARNVHKRDK